MTEKPTYIKDFEADEQMHNRLRNVDPEAWEQVYLKSVKPLQYMHTKNGIKYTKIMADRNLSFDEINNMLYENMLVKGELEKYQPDCPIPIFSWLRIRAGWIVLSYTDKEKVLAKKAKALSENIGETVYIDEVESHDKWELVNYCFTEIWRKDPMSAYIYLLRQYKMMSSDEIMKTFNISSIDNTYQLFSRTDKLMRTLLKKYGESANE